MTDYFSYYDGPDSIKDSFRISASQISRYFDSTSQWYHENFLNQEGFIGSTASELGTVVHAAAAMYFDTGTVDNQAIINHINSISNPEVDKSIIFEQYEHMVTMLINEYLASNKGTHSEWFVHKEILPGIVVGGSIDMYNSNKYTITDFKTMGSLDTARVPTKFPRSYWFQQMIYAWVLTELGHRVDYLELCYVTRNNTGRMSEKTGKPLKDYPTEVHIVREPVTAENLHMIEGCIKVIANSVKLWNEQPELRYILAQDYRLYQKPKPILFKD